ncbi:hypothetical protein ELE36_00035 (plasmid) [Pseudolysobacter antarcticus]|uniref:Uncharacterized protein n=1 Tax=Pseudolysobacter antarcticus TaxID=2511995 RepID=A0A411HEH6_9GAMM|nr:hypothetical protein [Pseudolysobacter antarcticus]QBB68890.1 hypothetical protein ELE36_00035 [Pseudolysobacter antarcticus]
MRLIQIRSIAPVSGVAFAIGIALSSASAFAEICGIDSIFADGYEVAGFVPIAQIAGSSQSPGLIPSIIGSGALSVAVTSPGTGATTGNSSVDVVGTFVGPVNTGIAVNNVGAYVVNGHFSCAECGIGLGSNSLTVQATTLLQRRIDLRHDHAEWFGIALNGASQSLCWLCTRGNHVQLFARGTSRRCDGSIGRHRF